MSSYSPRSIQYALYSLFMMADGEVTEDEQKRLRELAKATNVSPEDRGKIMVQYEDLSLLKGQDNSDLIISEMKKLFADLTHNPFEHEGCVTHDGVIDLAPHLRRETMWRMLTLAYSDSEYSKPEKKVIAFLKELWKINDDTMNEMLDTANTMLALANQKEWWKVSGKSYDDTTKHIKSLDEQIEHLYKSMDESIEEAAILERR